MATLATQFKAALGRIEPEEDANNAAEAHKEVSAALKADDRLKKLGVSPFLIGSYGRDVSIKRVKDVDVFVRLEKATSSLRPGDILDHVTGVLEDAFPDCVERQHRSVSRELSGRGGSWHHRGLPAVRAPGPTWPARSPGTSSLLTRPPCGVSLAGAQCRP